MSKALHLIAQADRFDRVADQCSVPELVPYYRQLAQDHRDRAAVVVSAPGEDATLSGAAD